jgi:hypothetical protein
VKGRFLLNVVIRERTTVFELLSGEDQTLLIRRDAFLVLNLRLDVVDGVGRLDFEGDLRDADPKMVSFRNGSKGRNRY